MSDGIGFSEALEFSKQAIGAIGGAADIASKIKVLFEASESSSDVEIKTALAALTEQIADAKIANADLKIQLAALIEENNDLKKSEDDLARYELFAKDHGSTVYALKKGHENGDPKHYLCSNCYSEGRKAILNVQWTGPFNHICPNCHTEYFVPEN